MIPTTKSSETSSPWKKSYDSKLTPKHESLKETNQVCFFFVTLSIASFALTPRGDLAATAARSMSPVDKWHKQNSSFMTGDCVPLPEPGGPANANHR